MRGFGNLPTTDIDDLEDLGVANPLIEGWEERITILKDLDITFFKEASIEIDSTTLRRDIKMRGGLIPETRTPAAGTINVSLEDLQIILFNSSNFVQRHTFSTDEAPASDDVIGEKLAIKAQLVWLNASLLSGDPVDTDAITETEFLDGIGGNRVYQYEQANGDLITFLVQRLRSGSSTLIRSASSRPTGLSTPAVRTISAHWNFRRRSTMRS